MRADLITVVYVYKDTIDETYAFNFDMFLYKDNMGVIGESKSIFSNVWYKSYTGRANKCHYNYFIINSKYKDNTAIFIQHVLSENYFKTFQNFVLMSQSLCKHVNYVSHKACVHLCFFFVADTSVTVVIFKSSLYFNDQL